MKFLLTNDDGINAAGLLTLERTLSKVGPVVVVAPREALSGCGHQVNTRRSIEVAQVAPGRYALDGTPADGTRLGLLHLVPDADWVVAGINHGGNLGADVYTSGTVAAVREAALLGKPGIAFSQYRRTKEEVDWAAAARMAALVVDDLPSRTLEPGSFWNVNFPDLRHARFTPRIVFCRVDPSPLPVCYRLVDGRYKYQGVYHDRARKAGADVDVLNRRIVKCRIVYGQTEKDGP